MSRIMYGREVLVAYNVTASHRNDFVIIDAFYHKEGDKLSFLYGGTGTVTVLRVPDGSVCVPLSLEPHRFVILEKP